jgi:N-acetylglucosaminyl-diphospho-decaprenol L-rhamnosyltransferase
MPVDISIIIVNWRSTHYLQKCLETIYRDVSAVVFEVIVIDNASYDGCDRVLMEHYPQVRFIQSTVNVGFGGANNFAYRQSHGKTLLFLNPDTEIIGQAISTMHRSLWEVSGAGAIGCTLLNSDGSLQTSCIQAFPTILNQLCDFDALRQRFPMLSLWGTQPLFQRSEVPMAVEVVSGACLMVKRNVFESAGLFSTDYFMYAEDTDLCFKIRSVGFGVYYTAAASAVHHGGGSSAQREGNYFAAIVMRESLFQFLTKHRGSVYGGLYRLSMCGAACFRITLLISLMVLLPRRSVLVSRKVSLGKWVKIFRWSLGFEAWASRLTHEVPPA